MSSLTKTKEWTDLAKHYEEIKNSRIFDMFENDKDRVKNNTICNNGIYFDFSKNLINEKTLDLLEELAEASDISKWRDAMFNGEKVNYTENRSALHTALRRPKTDILKVDGENIIPSIFRTFEKMETISNNIRNGNWKGFSGKKIEHVVNIGIGGSDLGSKMVCLALKSYSDPDISMHFVANLDGTDLAEKLKIIDPETTLFIVTSKTYTTQETIRNAVTAKEWLIKHFNDKDAVASHFIALSANEKAAFEFGIKKENILGFNDWVGGRYSLWSAVGMPIAISIGFKNFRELLDGAYSMDKHFCETPIKKNIPVLMGLIEIWNRNFLGCKSHAILPYDQYLKYLPDYLQQVDMESNGKSIDRDGNRVDYKTASIIFGVVGTNAQHSLLQIIHQGTDIVPCDFIISKTPLNPLADGDHHRKLQDNFLAQQQALMQGRNLEESSDDISRIFEGNRPCNGIIIDKLTPFNLGQIIAMYEHKIFVQGIIWRINSFDQAGVELGKILASNINAQRHGRDNIKPIDESTSEMLKYLTN